MKKFLIILATVLIFSGLNPSITKAETSSADKTKNTFENGQQKQHFYKHKKHFDHDSADFEETENFDDDAERPRMPPRHHKHKKHMIKKQLSEKKAPIDDKIPEEEEEINSKQK